jgi:predicted PurR-regulated permease PerM
VARALGRRGRPLGRSAAALLVYFSGVAAVATAVLVIGPAIIAQFDELRDALPSMFTKLQKGLVAHGLLSRPITLEQTIQTASNAGPGVAAIPVRALFGIIGGAVGLISIVFLSYYFIVEGRAILNWFLRFLPEARRPLFASIACEVAERVAAWLRANLILGAIMGTAAAVFLGLTGTPFFYVAAIIAAVGEAVPVVGSIVAGIVAVGLAATSSLQLAGIVAIFFFCLHELEANVLVPRLMERRVGVSAAALVIALLVGFELGGVIGIVIAVPTAAIVAAALEVSLLDRQTMCDGAARLEDV